MTSSTNSLPALPFLKDGITHVAIVVKDLEEAVEQYHRTFGIGPWSFFTYGSPLLKRMIYHGREVQHTFRIALAQTGSQRIELVQHVSGESIYADFIAEYGYGVQHLGVTVENMKVALAQAAAAGIAVIQEGGGFGLNGDGAIAYLDTYMDYGVILELVERPQARNAPDKVYPPQN